MVKAPTSLWLCLKPIDTKIIEIQVDVFFQKLELELKRRSIWKHHLQYIYLHIHFISCEYIPNPIKIYLHRHPFTTSIATSPYKSPEPPCQRPCRRTSHVAGLGGDPVRPIPWDDDWHIFTYILVGVLFDTKKCIGKYTSPMDPMFFFWALLIENISLKRRIQTSREQKCWFSQNPFPLFRYSTNPPSLFEKIWKDVFSPPSSTIFFGQHRAQWCHLGSAMPPERPSLLHSAVGRDDGKLLW